MKWLGSLLPFTNIVKGGKNSKEKYRSKDGWINIDAERTGMLYEVLETEELCRDRTQQ